MGKKVDPFIIDPGNIIPKRLIKDGLIFIILFSLLIGAMIGYLLKQQPVEEIPEEEAIFMLVEGLLETHKYCVGPVCVHENMTFAEARDVYYHYRTHPSVKGIVLSGYKYMCRGGY